jgi:thymidylate synthase
MIRDDKLLCITNMRSNDAILGLSYDMFSFTMLQEFVANMIGVEVGPYYHNAGSFHVYVKDVAGLEFKQEGRWTPLMDKMPRLEPKAIWDLYDIYMGIGELGFPFDDKVEALPPYLKDFAWAAKAFVYRKEPGVAKWCYLMIENYTVRRVMRPWLPFIQGEVHDQMDIITHA